MLAEPPASPLRVPVVYSPPLTATQQPQLLLAYWRELSWPVTAGRSRTWDWKAQGLSLATTVYGLSDVQRDMGPLALSLSSLCLKRTMMAMMTCHNSDVLIKWDNACDMFCAWCSKLIVIVFMLPEDKLWSERPWLLLSKFQTQEQWPFLPKLCHSGIACAQPTLRGSLPVTGKLMLLNLILKTRKRKLNIIEIVYKKNRCVQLCD